ncbi:DUF1839 family protein [Tsukamurella soli]|uniref:DUF1839 family protein n=1 Tax=Tsukamurella soli TaxID=644556 RepID=A0ABP8JX19_9ACTN
MAGLLGLTAVATSDGHRPAPAHGEDRIWRETNCYLDLWIELLHVLGEDPVPSLVCALSAGYDGDVWTFVKPAPEDLRELYGLDVAEENMWRPVLATVESGPGRGVLHTVEVDSWWLPDTEGTDYRTGHTKTTIVPLRVDRAAREMTYVHNAGVFELSGDDFDGVFTLPPRSDWVLLPYVEQVRRVRPAGPVDAVAVALAARAHLDRRPPDNPVARLGSGVQDAAGWLGEAGMDTFHLWAFATLRQCGATAEVAADLADYLAGRGFAGAEAAAEPLRRVAADAKAVQFKMARAARGRAVDVTSLLGRMAADWQAGIDALDRTLPRS